MNNVQLIYDAITSKALAVLGSEWSGMRKVFAPVQNDLRSMEKTIGVVHKAAPNFAGANQAFVFDHTFEVILSRRATNRDNDLEIQTLINDLYDKADDVLRDILFSKLSLKPVVIDVDTPAMEEPEVLDNGAVILRLSFIVKHWLDKLVV